MKSSLFKATVFFAASAFAASVGVADAQVDKDNGKCRGTVAKTSTKLNQTTMKTFDGCVKSGVKAGSGDCSTIGVVDGKGKISKAAAKLLDSVGGAKSKCDDTVHALSLAEHLQCSSPSAGQALPSWSDVSACLSELNVKNVVALRISILTPDFGAIAAHPLVKDLGKCANAIGKNATKLYATIQKERAKNQKGLDKVGGSYDYLSGAADPKGKIGKATTKLSDGLIKACGPLQGADEGANLNLIGSCDDDVAGIISCVTDKVTSSAGGLAAASYDQPGDCATQAGVQIRHLDTVLDVGWTGFGHGADTADGFVARVGLGCGASPNDCSNCAIAPSCEDGNCRCSNDPTIVCATSNGADAACGGNTCNNFFGPPLPLSAAGTPTCVVNKILSLTGTANLQTGDSDSAVENVAVVHLGLSQDRPCPTCDGGTCDGGTRDGQFCSVDASSPTFGDLSYDCQPDPLKNVTGAGLAVPLNFTSTSTSLPFALACDAPLGFLTCSCAICDGDSSVGCNSDADCIAVGAGTCTGTGGAARQPNACSDGSCNDNGDGTGTCLAGPVDGFCDGITKTNGGGVAPCVTDADCTALGAQFGACTIATNRPCFLDPIDADGTPGTEGAVLVSTFCVAPTASSAVNAAAGSPGPGRLSADFEFVPYCADKATLWGPGGANCQ